MYNTWVQWKAEKCTSVPLWLQEGGALRLEGQVQPARDPNLTIEWFKNGVSLATGESGNQSLAYHTDFVGYLDLTQQTF